MEDTPPIPPRSRWDRARAEARAWLVAVLMLATTFLVGGVLLAAANRAIPGVAEADAQSDVLPARVFVVRALATEVGLGVPALLVLAWSRRRISWGITGRDLRACAVALAVMFAANGAGSWVMTRIGERYEGFPSLTGGDWIVAAAFACATLAAPLAEELFFREALLCRVFGGSPRPYALAVTSLLFGALHASAGGVVLLITLSILGMALGWVRLRTGSLGAALALHALHNALAWALTTLAPGP